jgi:hypothetical protein
MAPGMQMGELDGEGRWSRGDDPAHLAVSSFFKGKSPHGYVRHWAQPPVDTKSEARGGATLMRTDWDVWVEAADEEVAQRAMLEMYGSDRVDVEPDVFVFRPRWKMRLPVAMARTNYFEWYDELGSFLRNVPFAGHVMFDHVINVSRFTTGSVETLINMLPVRMTERLGVLIEEATAPVNPNASA